MLKLRQFPRYVNFRRFFGFDGGSNSSEVITEFTNGKTLSISCGKLAKLADGCSLARLGDTTVMVTAVAKTKSSQTNFLPLVVDYRQKAAAAGRIPTNFLRRELGPSEREILTSRLIDRSLRPLFPAGFNCETQVVCNLLAVDGSNMADIPAINAASACLSISDIPWNGPIGAVRVGFASGEVLINPTRKELQASELDLIVVATKQNLVIMLEGCANNIFLQDLMKCVKSGTKECQHVINSIEKLQSISGKAKRAVETPPQPHASITEAIETLSEIRLKEIFQDFTHDKLSRDVAVNHLRDEIFENIKKDYPNIDDLSLVIDCFNRACKRVFRRLILNTKMRCDGRGYDDIRKISGEVDLYKPLHGSALFQRGQTQVLCTVALDSAESALKMDAVTMLTSGVKEKNFFLHYEFPPFATKETGRMGPVGRRELGHGALAEKGLLPIIPKDFPFTIRLTSEVLESNGSSSMASVCGGSMALMDAGIPVSSPAAGVAIGLITEYDSAGKNIENYAVLTDILGIEDYMGDMDFKIAGTKKGITALQADIKIAGLPLKIVMESISKASEAKSKVIDIMNTVIYQTRCEKKDNWPVNETLTVEAHKRSKLLGVGGINLKKLLVQTGVQVSQIDETTFNLFAPNTQAMDEAKEVINRIITEENEPILEFGAIYTAKIVDVRDIGVLVCLYPNMPPALLHNSQLDQRKVNHPTALGLKVGDELQVKYFGRDPVSGSMRLSRKVLQGPPSLVTKNLNPSNLD